MGYAARTIVARAAASVAAAPAVSSNGTATAGSLMAKGLPAVTKTPLNVYAPVAKWLIGTSGLVVGMVHIGGVTRLTKSGLSMTDWKPLGSMPPLNDAEWNDEFDRYKLFPEYQQRKSMTLDEFKYIFFWEWGHRMLGRVVGLCFALPWGYFTLRGKIPPGYQKRMAMLFTMGGTQGLVGWWMVKSGLGEDRRDDRKEIRVSPYRLAAHLGMAAATYSALVWTGLGVIQLPNESRLRDLASSMSKSAMSHARKLRFGALGVTKLAALTMLSGAFVAGNDAGNAYNTFPLMDEKLVPMDDMIDPSLEPSYRNAFENTAMVQFNHRWLGTTTAFSAIGLACFGFIHPAARSLTTTTPQVRVGLAALGTAAVGQMSLGVVTLLNYVPITLAAGHQLGSLVVLTSGLYTVHSLRYAAPSLLRVSKTKVMAAGTTGAVASAGKASTEGVTVVGKDMAVAASKLLK